MWKDPTETWEQADRDYRKHVSALWKARRLDYKLDSAQREVYRHFYQTVGQEQEPARREYVLDSSRRFGKDTIQCVIAVETALESPGGYIPYAAPSREMVREIIVPIMRWVLKDCPPEMRPDLVASRKEWVFQNGARIKMAGVDQDPDSLRGTTCAAAFASEAAFMRYLEYVLEDVIRPQLLTDKDSFLMMGSTPPPSPGHPWSVKYVPRAKARGMYSHKTIEDIPRIPQRTKEAYIEELGGRTATRCRRELFAEHVIEEDLAIVPEFQHVKDIVVCDLPRPDYFHAYVSLDPGWTHLCAGLFAYLDFLGQRVVVEGDFAARHANTREVATEIKRIERELWGDLRQPASGKPQPYMRYSDTDMRLIADLQTEHGILFAPTAKDNRDHAIAQTRVWMAEKKIWINPRCTTLIAHLDHGIWNKSRKDFEQTEAHGHFDAIAALVYLMRNVNWRKNPYPVLAPKVDGTTHFIDPKLDRRTAEQKTLASIFGGRRRK